MYSYYGLSVIPSMRKYLWWKKYLTQAQLVRIYNTPIFNGQKSFRNIREGKTNDRQSFVELSQLESSYNKAIMHSNSLVQPSKI